MIVHYDNNTNEFLGFYSPDENYANGIPTPNFEIDALTYLEALQNNINMVDPIAKTLFKADLRTLDEVKASKILEINTACKKAIESGFNSSALGSEHIYQSEMEDQLNLMGAAQSGVDQPFKCGIKDQATGVITWSYKPHTALQLKQVLMDGAAVKSGYLQNTALKKEQVEVSTTVVEVEAVVW